MDLLTIIELINSGIETIAFLLEWLADQASIIIEEHSGI